MSPALIKMPLASLSLSLLRHRSPAIFPSTSTTTALRRLSFIPILAKQNPHRLNQPSKNELRARDTSPKKNPFSSLSSLSSKDRPTLSPDQAIGMVASAQANFMRVIVQSAPPPAGDDAGRVGAELLCVVKAVLKKIRRKVLVGDKVLVSAIDWVDRRGWIENVFDRSSEILDPSVANVDHLLVLFSIDQPKIEPFTLTQFLVEAESTGIPLSPLNKTELVDEEMRTV